MRLKDVHDDDSLIVFCEDFFERSAEAKREYERQWLLNLAFLAGDQLVSVNKSTGRLDRVSVEKMPNWVVADVENRVLALHRNMTAKLTKSSPRPQATATSRAERHILAARAAVRLEEHHWKTLGMNLIHPEMVGWLVSTGNAFYKQFWNPEKGDRVVAEHFVDEGILVVKEFSLGDTDLVLRSPFNIYPEPGKAKMRDMRMVGDAEVMDVDEIFERYGAEVEPENDIQLVRVDHKGLFAGKSAAAGTVDINDNTAVVKELYILPCRKFPEGVIVTFAGGKILEKATKCEEIPITHFGLIDMPGRFWHKGMLDDVIPVQRRWNDVRSKVRMHNDYYNDPPVFYDASRIDIEEWTTEPGLQIPDKNPGRGGPPVTVLQVPALDHSIFRELEMLESLFELIPALHKVSFGRETSYAKSGIAINFLQEKDEDIVRPMVDNIEAGYAQVFKRDFKLSQANYQEDRGFMIVGEDNEHQWIEFKRADLDAEIDVSVEPGSAAPRSRAAKQAMVMDMLAAGFFTNPMTGTPDFAKALKYLEFGSVADIYEEASLDSSQAKRENLHMKEEGVPAVAERWHNHSVHMYEHNSLRKSSEYEDLLPEIKMAFEAHIQQHEQLVTQAMQEQQAMMQGQQAMVQGQEETLPADEAAMTEFEADQILADLQATDPEAYDQIMLLPEDQRVAALIDVMQQTGTLPA